MAAKKAAQATGIALLLVLLIIGLVYLYFQWTDAEQRVTRKDKKVTELEETIGELSVRLDNLSLQNEQLVGDLEGEQSKLEEVEKQAENLKAAEKRLKAQMEAALAKAAQERAEFDAKLEEQRKKEANTRSSLEEKLRATIASQDVEISKLKGKLRVDVANKILFKSGSAKLLPGGKKVLDELALALAGSADQNIQVAGHTDDVPIKKGSVRFPTNWELSAHRALAAVRYLEEVCGVPGRQLGAVGYGPYQPRVSNDSADNRA
ncbi:MAG: OmpA family protein, partial [Verrucomicrobiota bacterium]